MNPDTRPPRNDDDLTPEERELADLYRQLPRDEPEHALDDTILAQASIAAQAERSRRRRLIPRWPLGLATVAVLVLAAGLVWRMQVREPSARSSNAAAPAASEASRSARPIAPPPSTHPTTDGARAPAADVSATPITHVPQARVQHIRQLLHDGQRAEALTALDVLQRDYPDYPLPNDLRALASSER